MRRLRDVYSRRCEDCGRVFDLFDEVDADEWSAGHDCETRGMYGWIGRAVR